MSNTSDSFEQATNTPTGFLLNLRKGGFTLSAIDPQTGAIETASFDRNHTTEMARWIASRNGKKNLYYCPNRTKKPMSTKPKEQDMAYCDFLYVDSDPNKGESPAEANKRHAETFEAAERPPTTHYSSGNGRQGLWRLDPPIKLETEADIAACKAMNHALAKKFGGDKCHSLDHLYRIPFTKNLPNARKRAEGRAPIMSGDVVSYPEQTYCEFDFPEVAPSIVPEQSRAIGAAEPVEGLDELRLPDHVRELVEKPFEEGGKYASRSERDFAGITGMLRNQVTAEQVLGVLTSGEWPIGERLRERGDPEEATRKEIERALAKGGANDPAAEFPDDVPKENETKTLARFKALSLSSVMARPDPKWLIEGILAENALFEVFGQFKAGKTFFGLEIALCIATGLNFFDSKVTQGKVIFVIAEGNAKLFGYRVQAWIKERAGRDPKLFAMLTADIEANFAIVPVSVHMDVQKEVAAFLEANPGRFAAIFVDTLMRNMTGDPLKPADMMKFMAGCDSIRNMTGAAVVFFHHMRRDNGVGGFGSIVGEAFVDGAAIVERKGKERHFKLYIMRDADDSAPAWVCHLEPRNVLLDMSETGEVSRNTAVLVYDHRKGREPGIDLLAHIYATEPETVEALKKTFPALRGRTLERQLSTLRKKGYLDGLKVTTTGMEAVGDMEDSTSG